MPTTEYFWDPVSDTLIGEYDENGNEIVLYTTEPELHGEVISQHRADSGNSYYHHDGIRSTVALTDESGSVTDTYAYNAFGETVQRTGATTNPFGFGGALGYYANPETGDHYIRARMYRAAIARWLSVDPTSNDSHEYCYCSNDAINYVDPSGFAQAKAKPKQLAISLVAQNIDDINKQGIKACGAMAVIVWDFKILDKAPCEGYFVQQIDYYCNMTADCGASCPKTSGTDPDVTYWEAWYVAKNAQMTKEGGSLMAGTKTISFTDGSQMQSLDVGCGNARIEGTLKFFCLDKKDAAAAGNGTGDLGRKGMAKAPGWVTNGDYKNPEWALSGNVCRSISPAPLLSTTSEPPFWGGASIGGRKHRYLRLYYNCCACEKNFVEASASPMK